MNFWTATYRVAAIAATILVVVVVILLFTPQIHHYHELRKKEAALQEEIRLEEQILGHLKLQQERLRTDPRFVEKVAREDFGYAKPGETVFKFVDEGPTNEP